MNAQFAAVLFVVVVTGTALSLVFTFVDEERPRRDGLSSGGLAVWRVLWSLTWPFRGVLFVACLMPTVALGMRDFIAWVRRGRLPRARVVSR